MAQEDYLRACELRAVSEQSAQGSVYCLTQCHIPLQREPVNGSELSKGNGCSKNTSLTTYRKMTHGGATCTQAIKRIRLSQVNTHVVPYWWSFTDKKQLCGNKWTISVQAIEMLSPQCVILHHAFLYTVESTRTMNLSLKLDVCVYTLTLCVTNMPYY